ncbi:MAG: hypothetical protein GVY12_07105 [Bacteroidetes bacterium]|jgi:hypothetical protein|nr:hypothetical protein [Bacteroidota bacterium]
MTTIDGLEAALVVANPYPVSVEEHYFQYWSVRDDTLVVSPLVAPAGLCLELAPVEARPSGQLVGYTDVRSEDPPALAIAATLVPAPCE